MNRSGSGRVARWPWMLVAALAVLHHDFWFWADSRIVLGFLPIGLAYHAAFSLAAGFVWWLCACYAWPKGLEQWTEAGASTHSSTTEFR